MTPEETQQELLNRFQDFSEKLEEANKIAINQEEARLQHIDSKREENIWYGFATSLIHNEKIHLDDVPQRASSLTEAFIRRFPE